MFSALRSSNLVSQLMQEHAFVSFYNSTEADLVDSPPVLFVVPQHAGPQHVHHLWELFIHEGGSVYKKNGGVGGGIRLFTFMLKKKRKKKHICN